MSRVAVIYKSNYGSTKKYAEWISQAVDADLLNNNEVKAKQLSEYDCVIYGGGLYASGINGVDVVAKNPAKNLIVFTVGLTDPDITDYSEVIRRAFTKEDIQPKRVFHFRGGLDCNKLNFLHRNLFKLLKKAADKKTKEMQTPVDRVVTEVYGKHVDYTSQSDIEDLVNYVKDLVN